VPPATISIEHHECDLTVNTKHHSRATTTTSIEQQQRDLTTIIKRHSRATTTNEPITTTPTQIVRVFG
jgi:hypothetical protein